MINSLPIQQQQQQISSNKSANNAFSCSSSGYSSQSLSECDLNSNKNKTSSLNTKSSIDTLSTSPTSSTSSSTNQIDKINPSVLLLETTNSLSCIRTSTPTNPINSTTLDNTTNVYKSISSDCCYSDSNFSSQPSNLLSPQSHGSVDYFRQISFNPTCNSSSLYQQNKNYYYVNNMKCYGDQFQEQQPNSFSLISPISNLINNKTNLRKSNPESFISTSTKTSATIKQITSVPINPLVFNSQQCQPTVQLNEPDSEKKSKIYLVLTFIIKLLNCFNIFSIFNKKNAEQEIESIDNVYTSSTSLPLSSESNSSIPKILLRNKRNSSRRSNDLACKLYAQSVLVQAEKRKFNSIESPSSFNFVGFGNNCTSSTPIQQQQNKEPVVKIKSNKMNIAAIESQLSSPFYSTNYTNKLADTSEQETYDHLPVIHLSTQSNFIIPFPTNLSINNNDEVEHYVKINTLESKSNKKTDFSSDLSNNSTNYDNDLEQIASREIFSSSSPSSNVSSSSSLVNSVNIYLSHFNKTGQSINNSTSSATASTSSCSFKQDL